MPRMQTLVDPFELVIPVTAKPAAVAVVLPSNKTPLAAVQNVSNTARVVDHDDDSSSPPVPRPVSDTWTLSEPFAASERSRACARARCWCSEE